VVPVLLIASLLVALTAFAETLSSRIRVASSILLVVLGIVLSFVPAMPLIPVDPDLVLLVFLPPLLYSSGVGMSWPGFCANLRPILLLAVGCVLITASAVAAVAHWLLDVPWAVGFVLGAVVSPPDAVAPMSIARRLNLPSRLLTILEGEGLVNDATALILFTFAVSAVVTGGFSIGTATLSFAVIVAGELAWGLSVGWLLLRLRYWARDPQVEIVLALLTPFVAFWPPHMLGGSGVLAAVSAGLYVSWSGPRLISAPTRLQGYFVWGLVTHVIEGLLFLLTGLQAKAIFGSLTGAEWRHLAYAGLVISLVIVVVRLAWVYPATFVPRWISAEIRRREPRPTPKSVFLIGFTGIRGSVSLAAALSIPLLANGSPFPGRTLILFVTFCIIVVTLIGQGSALPWLIGRLGLAEAGRAEAGRAKAHEIQARIVGVRAALAELDRLEKAGAAPAAVAALRRRHEDRCVEFAGIADAAVNGNPAAEDAELQDSLIKAERRKIGELYDLGELTDEARRRVERELDLEEVRNRHALESATGDRLADPELQ
jgi:Na+/H+ antiporter